MKLKINKATGLVPVQCLVVFTTAFVGDVLGVVPIEAEELLAKKQVKLIEHPEGVETETVDTAVLRAKRDGLKNAESAAQPEDGKRVEGDDKAAA